MRAHPEVARFKTTEGRQILNDQNDMRRFVFDQFADRFTRRFLKPHRKALITISSPDSTDIVKLAVRPRDLETELHRLRALLSDEHGFELKVYDGRTLFGDAQ
jgi:hypothetical protein